MNTSSKTMGKQLLPIPVVPEQPAASREDATHSPMHSHSKTKPANVRQAKRPRDRRALFM